MFFRHKCCAASFVAGYVAATFVARQLHVAMPLVVRDSMLPALNLHVRQVCLPVRVCVCVCVQLAVDNAQHAAALSVLRGRRLIRDLSAAQCGRARSV